MRTDIEALRLAYIDAGARWQSALRAYETRVDAPRASETAYVESLHAAYMDALRAVLKAYTAVTA